MCKTISSFQRYMGEVLGVRIEPERSDLTAKLPYFLQEQYDFYEGELLGMHCLLLTDRMPDGESPAAVRKHVRMVEELTGLPVILLRLVLSSFDRHRFIEQRVSFVIPGNQMYLPMLGIDLREHYRRVKAKTEVLSPSAQATFIYCLLHMQDIVNESPGAGSLTPSWLANKLDYSVMTLGRAFDQLESLGLAEFASFGRERRMRFDRHPRELWEQGQAYLRTPVKSKRHAMIADEVDEPMLAGLTALGKYTMLAEPECPVRALTLRHWSSMHRCHALEEVPIQVDGSVEVEIWQYSPRILSGGPTVDKLSLYLSLRDEKDERVESALEELMEGMKW